MNSHPNSVLIFVESPFGIYDAERFDLDLLRRLVDLVVIDITPLVKPEYWARYGDRSLRDSAIIVAESWSRVDAVMKSRHWDAWVDELGVSRPAQRVRSYLRRSRCVRVRIRLGLLPGDFVIQSNTKARLAARRSQLGILGVLKNLVLFIPRRIVRRVPPPDLVFGSGSYTQRDVPAGSTIIWAHSFDYEKSLREKSRRTEHLEGHRAHHTSVFLDQNLGFHPDQLHSGIHSPVEVESYYSAMRKTFDRIEETTKGLTTIAVHPKSSFADPITIFGGRQGVREGAQTVVRNSDLVLCHASASLSYAVIWRKPVLFLTSDDLDNSWYKSHINEMARMLDRPVVNIDRLDDITARALHDLISREVNEQRYATYEEQFIRSRWSREGPLWQIFVDGLQEYLAQRQ